MMSGNPDFKSDLQIYFCLVFTKMNVKMTKSKNSSKGKKDVKELRDFTLHKSFWNNQINILTVW